MRIWCVVAAMDYSPPDDDDIVAAYQDRDTALAHAMRLTRECVPAHGRFWLVAPTELLEQEVER